MMELREIVDRLVILDRQFKYGAIQMAEANSEMSGDFRVGFVDLYMFIADLVGMPMDNTFILVDRYGIDALKKEDYFSREFVIELFDKRHEDEISQRELVDMLVNWEEYPHNTKGGIYFDVEKYLKELEE